MLLVLKSQLQLASSPGSFPLSAHGGKEPGTCNIGGFKPLTSGGLARAPPIGLQNKVTLMRDSLKAWLTSQRQTRSYKTVINLLLVSDGALRNGDFVEES